MRIIYSPRFLEHRVPKGFPEQPRRLQAIVKALGDEFGDFVEPSEPDEEELCRVHSKQLVGEVRLHSSLETREGDNPFCEKTFETAKLACSAAWEAARLKGFALTRPPGHHAGKNFYAGFCYFNNLAFAVQKLLDSGKAEKVLVADFDLHHGNGTQDVFSEHGEVFCVSVHQDPRHTYPGTGLHSGERDLNVCVSLNASNEEYLNLFEEGVGNAFDAFQPDVLAVSAGFDCAAGEEAIGGTLSLGPPEFKQMGAFLKDLHKKRFGVLEGGYNTRFLGENVKAFLKGFG